MPDFASMDYGVGTQGFNAAPSGSNFADTSLTTPDMQKQVAAGIYGRDTGYGTLTTLAGDAAFGAVDLADTVASSIPFLSKAAGIQRGDLNESVLNAIDMPNLRDFYEANQGGIHAASAVYGIIAADLATGGLAGAPAFTGLLSGVSWGRKALALDTEYKNSLKAVQLADETLAGRGLMGSKLFTSEMGLSAAGTASELGLDPAIVTASRTSLVRKAAGLGALKAATRAAGTEAIMATTLNQNDFLYSADAGQNIAFAALGLGTAGLIGNLGAKFAIRKFTNSDSMRRIAAEALDPTGQMNALTIPPQLSRDPVVNQTYLGSLQGSRTDKITSLYTAARSAAPEGADKSTFERLATQYEKLGQEEIQKVAVKGLPGIDGSNFSTSQPGYGNQIYEMMHKDPGAMLGVESIGGIGDGMSFTGTHEEFQTKIADRLAQTQDKIADPKFETLDDASQAATFRQLKNLKFMQTLVPTPVIDGEVTTMSHAANFDNWIEPEIKSQIEDGVTTFTAFDRGGPSRKISVASDGDLTLPGDRTINNASHEDMLNLFRAGQQQVGQLARDPKAIMSLPDRPNWFQLDMAQELLSKNPSATVQWPAGMTRETAQVESFAQKVDAIKKLGQKLDPDQMARLRVRFNLPRLSAFEAGMMATSDSPMDVLLRGAIAKGGGNAVRGMSLQELMGGIDASRKLTDIAGRVSTKADTTMGNSFSFMTDSQGQPMKPMLMYRRPFMQEDFMRDNVAERIGIKKAQTISYLVKQQGGPMTQQLSALIAASPDTTLASQVNGLTDAQLMSSVPGFAGQAPSTPAGRFLQGVTTAENRARDNPTLLAAIRLRESIDRQSQAHMKGLFQSAMGDSLATVNGPRNTASKFMLNQFHSFAGGWDIAEQPVQTVLADGSNGWNFPLEDTVGNHQRFESMFGRKMTQGDVLMDPSGKQVALDDLGMDTQSRFNQITDQMLNEKNALLEAVGLPSIHRKPWYTPPPSVEGKFVGFTFDPMNQIVPGGTVIANTEDSFNRQVAKLASDPTSIMNRENHSFRTQNEVKEFATLMDKAQMDMMNPGRTFIQGAKPNEGGLLSANVSLSALDDSLTSVRDELMQHGRDVLETMMEDQLKAATARSRISGGEQVQGGRAFGAKDSGKNVFDYYIEAMTGRNPLASEKSVLGKIQASLTQPVDAALRQAAVPASRAWAATKDYLASVNPFNPSETHQGLFNTLTEKLGDQMPFQSVADLMDARGYGAKPVSLKGIAAGTGRFEAAWILRMLEPVQAVMNLTGVINAAPAVVRHLAMKEGQTVEDYAAMHGHAAQIFTTPDAAKSFGVMDPARLMYSGFKRAWSGAADQDWARLANKGMLSQEVAEFQRAFNASENRSGWDMFMNGNPNSDNKFAKKGVVGWASLLTDKSEDFSRAWGHMVGDELGRTLGIVDDTARDNFAHDIANKMIANYNPLNRPAIFQGALGTPIGLFQGFIWAYYQRMFRYLETGDSRAIATQYATQAASFGLKTVPGFQEVNNLWFEHSDGKNSPYDEIYKRFGSSAGDSLMGGVWGNLPKLFGGKAIDLSARGDTTFRTPVFNQPAIFQTASKIGSGIGQMLHLFGSQNPHLSGEQIAEIASNTIPNRPMANLIEQFGAGGNDTDATGQLVSKSRDWMDTTARVLGTRTMTQSNELNAFYSNKQATEIRAQQRETLLKNTRSLIRGGDVAKLPGVFQQYVADGGDPRYFKGWVKSSIQSATQTRGERQVTTLMHNPANQELVDRLLGTQTGITAEAQQEDPRESMQVQDTMLGDQPAASPLDNADMQYGQGNFQHQ